mgnify:CR=1 FL=1
MRFVGWKMATLAVLAAIGAIVGAVSMTFGWPHSFDKAGARRDAQHPTRVRAHWLPDLFAAEIDYPPASVTFVIRPDQHALDVYARASEGSWKHVRHYTMLVAKRKGAVVPGLYGVSGIIDNRHGLRMDLIAQFPEAGEQMAIGSAPGLRRGVLVATHVAVELVGLAKDVDLDRIRVIVARHDSGHHATTVFATSRGDATGDRLAAALAELMPPEPPQPRWNRDRSRVSTPRLFVRRDLAPTAATAPTPE